MLQSAFIQRLIAKIAPILNSTDFMAVGGWIELSGEDPGGSGDEGPGATTGGAGEPLGPSWNAGLRDQLLAAAVGALEFFAALTFALPGEAQSFGGLLHVWLGPRVEMVCSFCQRCQAQMLRGASVGISPARVRAKWSCSQPEPSQPTQVYSPMPNR